MFTNLVISGVLIDGITQGFSAGCPPLAGEYCFTLVGSKLTITLGSVITTSNIPLEVQFTLDAPATPQPAVNFTSIIRNTTGSATTSIVTVPGDADLDPTDATNINDNDVTTVETVSLSTDFLTSTFVSDRLVVPSDGSTIANLTATLFNNVYFALPDKVVRVYYTSPTGLSTATLTQPVAQTDANGIATATISSPEPGEVIIYAQDETDTGNIIRLNQSIRLFFSRGKILEIRLSSNKEKVVTGDVVTYTVDIMNSNGTPVDNVYIRGSLPGGFKIVKDSLSVSGVGVNPGNKPYFSRDSDRNSRDFLINFTPVPIPGFIDSNSNGIVDKGEQGLVKFQFQAIVGPALKPGNYENEVYVTDVESCTVCLVSNKEKNSIEVVFDPLFGLGTIIGKVYNDLNKDSDQDEGETGIGGVIIAMENGTYVTTDEHGRYSIPAVVPGRHVLKINLNTLGSNVEASDHETVILDVREGLIAKANFPVHFDTTAQEIGDKKESDITIARADNSLPVLFQGNIRSKNMLINGEPYNLPLDQKLITHQSERPDGKIELDSKEVAFKANINNPQEIKNWTFLVENKSGSTIHKHSADAAPPSQIVWKLAEDKSKLGHDPVGVYYRIVLNYTNGTSLTSERTPMLFEQKGAIDFELNHTAFNGKEYKLLPGAKKDLDRIAKKIKEHKKETILIEGHTDAVGTQIENSTLSLNRAQSVADYLQKEHNIPESRIIVKGHGESRPIAGNKNEEQRKQNRRVTIRNKSKRKVATLTADRITPSVSVNGKNLRIDKHGRFISKFPIKTGENVPLEILSESGQSFIGFINTPKLELSTTKDEDQFDEISQTRSPIYLIEGSTDDGAQIEIDGKKVRTNTSGYFRTSRTLKPGDNLFTVVATSANGLSTIKTIKIKVSGVLEEKDDKNRPYLKLNAPKDKDKLNSSVVAISGETNPGTKVIVNGKEVEVSSDGYFALPLHLQAGENNLTVIARDSRDRETKIERSYNVSDSHLFFVALVDGEYGQLEGEGYIDAAGMNNSSEFYDEGRVAYYLKGRILGKYLITSAFDTGLNSFDKLFEDLDDEQLDRFYTNLDPDKYYPIYGDSSSIHYDTEGQGKFYLALTSDELEVLVGNYNISFRDTELANYQRKLHGAHVKYRSVSTTKFGEPNTLIELFASQVRQAHIQNRLKATGGSLYYLSHQDIVEGSEDITVVVLDQKTGLPIRRTTQTEGIDYSIKYQEGRILFNRPIQSIEASSEIIDEGTLGGNPVYIEVGYEYNVEAFDKSMSGGRIQKSISDHVLLGATSVHDQNESGEYELNGVDAEIRLHEKTRIIGEVAQSKGNAGSIYTSEDGGLSYTQIGTLEETQGQAIKLATQIDIGDLYNKPGQIEIKAYTRKIEEGFVANGSHLVPNSENNGGTLLIRPTEKDTITTQYDKSTFINADASAINENTSVQWQHKSGDWTFTNEVDSDTTQIGEQLTEQTNAASSVHTKWNDVLSTRVEHQQTLDGVENHQTTIGSTINVTDNVSLTATGMEGSLGRSAQAGMRAQMGKSSVYVNEQFQEDSVGRGTKSTVGGDYRFTQRGKVYSEYHTTNRTNQDQAMSLLGVQKTWLPSDGYSVIGTSEYSQVNNLGKTQNRAAISGMLSYNSKKDWVISTRDEIRREWGSLSRQQLLTSNNAKIKLNPDLSLLGKYRYSITNNFSSNIKEAEFEERQVALAYRPRKNDRLNVLARYTIISDLRPVLSEMEDQEDNDIQVASVEWIFSATKAIEWSSKLALKTKTEKTGILDPVTTNTFLSINRINFRLTRKVDIGSEYRLLQQLEADSARTGAVLDVGWRPQKNIRLGTGYNFVDFSDSEFSDNNYSVRGWFVRVQGMY
ncbi:MAG: OmpA family protein [Gammaproteobacteria bacterium]|nr:OmpA family protein [Gammaproteobacteria bacterium]